MQTDRNVAWDFSIFPQHLYPDQLAPVHKNSLLDSKQLHMMWYLHPASLNCPSSFKIVQASYEIPEAGDLTALRYLYHLIMVL